jgi:hypothetical protein
MNQEPELLEMKRQLNKLKKEALLKTVKVLSETLSSGEYQVISSSVLDSVSDLDQQPTREVRIKFVLKL